MLRARLPAAYPESARTCTSSGAHGRTLKSRVERIIFLIKNTSCCVCRDVLTFKRASFEVQGHFSFLCQIAKPLATLSIRKLQNKAQFHFIGGAAAPWTPLLPVSLRSVKISIPIRYGRAPKWSLVQFTLKTRQHFCYTALIRSSTIQWVKQKRRGSLVCRWPCR